LEIRLVPERAFYPVGDTVRATAVGVLPDGTAEPLVSDLRWQSFNPTLISIENSTRPLIHVLETGTATLELRSGSRSTQLSLLLKGLLHRASLHASEIWRAADAPHVVEGFLTVGGVIDTATLTIEPTSEGVVFRAGSGLLFGNLLSQPGRLVIPPDGPTLPIYGDPAVAGSWAGIYLSGAGQSELRNVTLKHCGAPTPGGATLGCLAVSRGSPGIAPTVLIDGVTISSGRGVGISLDNDVTVALGSRNLTITGIEGHPATVTADIAGRMPKGGRYDGNSEDAIWISPSGLERSTTLSSLGVPWRLTGGGIGVSGLSQPVLTIPAGTVIRADANSGISVARNGRGSLVVGDPTGPPVTFEPSVDTWSGIELSDGSNPSALYHVVMRDCGNEVGACLSVLGGAGTGSRVLVQDVTIRNSRSAGVALTAAARFEPGSTGLTITGSATVPVSLPPDAVASLPLGNYRGNSSDVVRLSGSGVAMSSTWRDVGVPYLALQGLTVGSFDSDPVLTIESGVVLQLGSGARVVAGENMPGSLVVNGTASAQVRFTSVAAGTPGSWMGVELGNHADNRTHFNYLEILDAGAGELPYAAAVRLQLDPGGVLRHTTVRRSQTCGVVLFNGNPWAEDYTDPSFGNTFEDLGGPPLCRQ
jgi:hypothetical protein